MQVAAAAVPLFPNARGPVFNHVQVTGITGQLQKAIQPVCFPGLGSPFGDNRNTYQAGGQMATIYAGGAFFQGRYNFLHFGSYPCE